MALRSSRSHAPLNDSGMVFRGVFPARCGLMPGSWSEPGTRPLLGFNLRLKSVRIASGRIAFDCNRGVARRTGFRNNGPENGFHVA